MNLSGRDEDRFFVNLNQGYMEWMYYNPDSNSGGQFVLNRFTQEHFIDAIIEYPKGPIEKIFEYVEATCDQYLADAGTSLFRRYANRFEHEAIATGISLETFRHLNELFMAVDLINTYCWDEFGSKADFSNLRKIGLAYTTTEDEGHEIQVYANVREYQIEIYLDDQLIETDKYASLKEMNEKCLINLAFDELVHIPDDVMEQQKKNAGLNKRCGLMYDLYYLYKTLSENPGNCTETKTRNKKEKVKNEERDCIY